MESYDIIGKFYDEIMGDQADIARHIRKFISGRNPDARSLLEVACGTGALMKQLSRHYEVMGLDISSTMLAMAHHKFRHITLYQSNMVDFSLNEKFDVIICMNDSINHLLKFSEWKKLFSRVNRHLNEKGVFIFDVNTEHKLKTLSESPPVVHGFEKNVLITTVSKSDSLYEWHLRIFEHVDNDRYLEHEETLYEKAFPLKNIRDGLSDKFGEIKIYDIDRSRVSPRSERLYFVATKKR